MRGLLRQRLRSGQARRSAAGGSLDRTAAARQLPEPLRNELLRRVDWRFLLRQPAVPRALDLTSGPVSEALPFVSEPAPRSPGSADLVVIGFPTRKALRTAGIAADRGGEVVCVWRRPRLAGPARARARLERAGFAETRCYWPGLRAGDTEFWLPLDAPEAVEHVRSERPPRSPLHAAMRHLWRLAARFGALAPLVAVARRPGDLGASGTRDELGEALPRPEPWVLITAGQRSSNKVVGLPFVGGTSPPSVVVKFARDEESDTALEAEAKALRWLAEERPDLLRVPRLLAEGTRAGRRAIAQTAIHGQVLGAALTMATFADFARRVTAWLIDLAGAPDPRSASEWYRRLVVRPLDDFELHFEPYLERGGVARARQLLGELEGSTLPLVFEHRDLDPFNMRLSGAGELGVLDWEGAAAEGLPGLDLILFLERSGFYLDGVLRTGQDRKAVLECHRRLLDPTTDLGKVAAECTAHYCDRLGLEPNIFARLRLLCWVLHAVIHVHWWRRPDSERPAPDGPRPARFGPSAGKGIRTFTILAEEEMRRLIRS